MTVEELVDGMVECSVGVTADAWVGCLAYIEDER